MTKYNNPNQYKNAIRIGLAGLLLASTVATGKPAKAEKGWFIQPEAALTFMPKEFNHGTGKIGIGGGVSLGFGYQFDAWQWETAIDWHYMGGSNLSQVVAGTPQTATVGESLIPIYTGINYTFPFLQSIDTTIGVGGGVMLYAVNKTFSPTTEFNDKGFVARGLLVPKVQMDYAITDNLTITAAGKFYFVFNGYNDLYSDSAKAAVATNGAIALPDDKLLWYGALTVGTNYRF
ncbi:MAG: hypothetical protein QM529_04250 [Hydrotalea sp.]|nr:hypothetical protein [Hydrotalea sp.]